MACQIKRDFDNNITRVLAANGKESIAYNSLLDAVNSQADLSQLKSRFGSWIGKHIENVNDPKELALALYKQMYSPAFKEWFGDWEKGEGSKVVDTNGEPLVVYHNSPKEFSEFKEDQFFTTDREHAAEFGGKVYPSFLNITNPKEVEEVTKSTVSKFKEPQYDGIISENMDDLGAFVVFKPNQIKSVLNQGAFSSKSNNIYLQQPSTTIPSKASPETIKAVKSFLSRIGAEQQVVDSILINGTKPNAATIVDGLKGLIIVTQGKEDVALPEEAMHLTTALIKINNQPLYKELMNKITGYKAFSSVVNEYKGNKLYQLENGQPDIVKLKEETIAKVLAETIINKNENATEKPELLSQTKNWWQRIVDFLKGLFLKAGSNPFEETAEKILKAEDDFGHTSQLRDEDGNVYFQLLDNLSDKIDKVNENVAKTKEGYELNGNKIKKSAEKEVSEFLRVKEGNRQISDAKKAVNQFKEETENKVKQDIRDILNRYIDDNGRIRDTPLEHTNPSAVNGYDNTFYNTLDEHFKERLAEYNQDTVFKKFVNVYDGINTAGTIDLLAITPEGKVDILQFKVPNLYTNASDISRIMQEAYNIEVNALRKILQKGYGIKKEDFRQTRAIPIRATYEYNMPGVRESGLKLSKLTIGNAKVDLIEDDVLLPVPSSSEVTGKKKLDSFISRIRGLVQSFVEERVPPSERNEKTKRINSLMAAIRKLQVQAKADAVISSGKTLIKKQKERFTRLEELIKNTDSNTGNIGKLNNIASEVMEEKDQVELYSEMYDVFRAVFNDESKESQQYIKDAREVSDDARDLVNKYWDMAVDFRTKKLAAVFDINDEFEPEKQLTWYRRMVRSLSQSSIKAGAILWELVSRMNNRYRLEFQDRLKEVKALEKNIEQWLGGRNINELYKRIFQIDDKNRWNGKFVQKFDKEFYSKIRQAQEKGDYTWVKENIDMDAYDKWYREEHRKAIANSKTARIHENDEINSRLVREELQAFVDKFYIRTGPNKGVNTSNWALKDFPREDKWLSPEYKELQKPGNEPVLALYDHWIKRLEESMESGVLQEHNGWSFFPNVRKNLIEKLTNSKSGGKLKTAFGSLILQADDEQFGRIDPLTGRPMNEVVARYIGDLGEWVKDADGNYFKDYGNKSMDMFKVMALWDREIIKYKLKTESESLAKLLAFTEEGKKALKTKRSGAIDRDKEGNLILVDNEVNAKYIKDHLEAVYYGKNLSDESDISLDIPYKAAVQRINKLFGREVIQEPEEETLTVSGTKLLNSLNRFYMTKTLGINVFTSASNLFGGTVNSYINQGIYFNKKELSEAELQYVSGRFWGSEEDKKLAGLLAYFHPFLEDKTEEQVRHLSVSKAVRYLSSDHLFYLQRGSDVFVDSVIGLAFLKMAMVKDGKIVNIREYARQELGYANKYSGTYEQSQEFDRKLEERVAELRKSPEALVNYAQVVNDELQIPGIERYSDTNLKFRAQMLEFVKDALGNTSREDLSLYKRSVMWQSFFMFKNWIPRMVDVRGQSLKYNPGTQKYEWGRLRMLGTAVRNLGLKSTISLIKQLGGNNKDIIEVAKKVYEQKRAYFAEQEQEFNMNEAEFVDMYIKGVRSEFKELGLALSLMALLIAARLHSPPKDEDPSLRGAYKWMLRGLDKFQDEVSFFYNPSSFTDIVNGSVFPAIGLLVEIQKFLKAGIAKTFYTMIGDDQKAGRQHPSTYLFKIMPITKELITYIAIFDNDIAKEYGIKISSQNGSSR